MAAEGLILTSEDGPMLTVRGAGRWVVAVAAELDRRLKAIAESNARQVTIDLADIEALDTAGAWLVLRTLHRLEARGRAARLENLRPELEPLFRQVEEGGDCRPVVHPPSPFRGPIGLLLRVGDGTVRAVATAASLVGFLGLVTEALLRAIRHPSRLRWRAILAHMEQTGVDALPIVGLLAFLIGVVLTYQGADQLRQFGAQIYTVNLLGISILREMGVLMTAIIIAGRSGSAFTAQIGTMKVSEEIDALRTLGLDPVDVLVLPRLIALLITLPLLTVFANFMGLLGGAILCWFELDMTVPVFLRQLRWFMTSWTFWIGLMKAPFFAGVIAITGCYEGLRTERSAESVGRLTTLSVVESIFLVIVLDALFSILFSLLRI